MKITNKVVILIILIFLLQRQVIL